MNIFVPSFAWMLIVVGFLFYNATIAASCDELEDQKSLTRILCHILLVLIASGVFKNQRFQRHQPTDPVTRIRRSRKSVRSIFQEFGPGYTRRAYRMTEETFWVLHDKLKGSLIRCRDHSSPKKHRDGAVNGMIDSSARLSMALRYFAGAQAYDLGIMHGVCYGEVYRSAWRVVNAVNNHPELDITFPRDHDTQRKLASQFQKKSLAGFDCCVGAIDGLLIWMERPQEADCLIASCGAKKFFCGRKRKFGINMQATCDANCRFLDVFIKHPDATSDYLAFETSPLKHLLERDGFLAPGLCLFDDNAYINAPYMATPYKGVLGGMKDAYNFFHSSLRIKIERAFGMLIH